MGRLETIKAMLHWHAVYLTMLFSKDPMESKLFWHVQFNIMFV